MKELITTAQEISHVDNLISIRDYLAIPNNTDFIFNDHYYLYNNNLVNLKNKTIFRNIKLSPDEPLSQQIQHPIIIPDNLIKKYKFITILNIKTYDKSLYTEKLFQKYENTTSNFMLPKIPRLYMIEYMTKYVKLTTKLKIKQLDDSFNIVNENMQNFNLNTLESEPFIKKDMERILYLNIEYTEKIINNINSSYVSM